MSVTVTTPEISNVAGNCRRSGRGERQNSLGSLRNQYSYAKLLLQHKKNSTVFSSLISSFSSLHQFLSTVQLDKYSERANTVFAQRNQSRTWNISSHVVLRNCIYEFNLATKWNCCKMHSSLWLQLAHLAGSPFYSVWEASSLAFILVCIQCERNTLMV